MVNVEKFAKEMAYHNVLHQLDTPEHYGLSGYAELYDLLTGDTAYDKLPSHLRADIGSVFDLENLAMDLKDKYDGTVFVLRQLVARDDVETILEEIRNGY